MTDLYLVEINTDKSSRSKHFYSEKQATDCLECWTEEMELRGMNVESSSIKEYRRVD